MIIPRVSVIIPTYNKAKILSRTISSVLNQTFKDLELIVIDDGSTDNTREIVSFFVEKDERVKYFYQNNSGGAANPKNNAIKYCGGEYIAYLDHDDEWLPTKIEKQLFIFENNKERKIGLVSCNVLIINNGKQKGVHRMLKFNNPEDILKSGEKYAFSNSSILIPKYVIDIVGPRDENLKIFEDQDIMIRIAMAGYEFDFVDEPLVKYYIDDENFSKDFSKAVPDYERFINKHYDLLCKHPGILSIYYRHLGTMNLLAGFSNNARHYFIKSIKAKLTLRGLLTAFCSILGKNFYSFILDFKKNKSLIK